MNKKQELETSEVINSKEFSLEGILIFDNKAEIKYIDDQLKLVLGYNGQNITFNFFANLSSEFRTKLNNCFLENAPCNFRQYVRESKKWFKCYVFPFDGNFIVHFSELSYLLDLEHKFSALLDSTTDLNILVDLEYNIISFNKSSELFAKDVLKKELKNGGSILDYFPVSDIEEFKNEFDSASEGNFFTCNKRLTYNESVYWFKMTFMPYYFHNSREVKGISFNSVDITNIINNEEVIADKESIINEIFRNSKESYLFISKDLKVLYKNDAVDLIYPDFFGAVPKIGDSAITFINNEKQEEFKELFKRVLKGDTIQFHRNNGILFWRIFLFPVFNSVEVLIGIAARIEDIKTQKTNEKKLIEQNKKLDEIAWNHSHILRKPLANIFGIYNVLRDGEKIDDEAKESYLVHLYAAVKEIDDVIHNVVKSIRGN